MVKVGRSGEIMITLEGFGGATALDVSPRTGECWVVDTEGDRVLRLGAGGERLTATDELSAPFKLQGQWWELRNTSR